MNKYFKRRVREAVSLGKAKTITPQADAAEEAKCSYCHKPSRILTRGLDDVQLCPQCFAEAMN